MILYFFIRECLNYSFGSKEKGQNQKVEHENRKTDGDVDNRLSSFFYALFVSTREHDLYSSVDNHQYYHQRHKTIHPVDNGDDDIDS